MELFMNGDMASSLSFLKEIKPAWESTSEVIFFFPLKFTVQPKKAVDKTVKY